MEDLVTLQTPFLSLAEKRPWFIRPSLLVGLIYILLISFFVMVRHYSILNFVHLGTVWGQHNPAGTWGYDGQFYYQMARNPLGAAPYMDNAPYRYQRLLYGLLAWVLSFGQVQLVPYTLLLINLLSIIGSVEIISLLLRKYGLSPWFSLGLGLYYGQAVALTFDTTEPFTCFLVCLGLLFLEKKQLTASALWLGLAAVSRETAVLFPLSLASYFIWKRQWKEAAGLLILGVLPLLIFLVSIAEIFGKTGVTFTPPFEHIPFAGIFYYQHTPRKFWLLVVMQMIPLLGSLCFLAWDFMRRRFTIFTLLWISNLALLIFMSHFSYLEMVGCGRVAIAPILAGMLYAIKSRNKPLLWALQFCVLTFLIYLLGTAMHLDSFIA